jgi:hypothetical protein
MTDEVMDETLDELEANAELAPAEGDLQEPETQEEVAEAVEAKPDPKDEEIARLQAENKRKDDRLALEKGHKKQLVRLVKSQLEDGLLDEEEAATKLGVKPEQLRGLINAPDVADNPTEVQIHAFDQLYVKGGVKDVLDEVYGDDTQKYVDAFGRFGLNDPYTAGEFHSLEQAKLPVFVVKKGKELLERQQRTLSLEDKVRELEAQLEAIKTGQQPSFGDKPKSLPLSGLGGGTANSGSSVGSPLPKGMF